MPDLRRRAFLRGKVTQKNSVFTGMRLPWTVDESEFTAACTRCDQCIEQCPENILIRGNGAYPEIDFKRGECTFCRQCLSVCKADVFIKEKHTLRNAWDFHAVIASQCLALNAIVCRACGDSCATQAIRFRLKTGGIAQPEVRPTACTACGACVHSCPVNAVITFPK